jgi:AcrR family transcriptional regulator
MEDFHSALEAFEADNSPQGRVLRAGLQLIETLGIDRVTVAAILGEAKVVRGTVYAHFGEVFGVFAAAWTKLGAPWLRLMMMASDESMIPPQYRGALVQILLAARRAPVLHEVVRPDVDSVWAELDRSTDTSELRAVWLLITRLSLDLSLPVLPDANALVPLVGVIASIPDDAFERYGLVGQQIPKHEIPAALSPIESENDDITRRLMVAAVDVVAGSGLATASMLRVCRTARLTPGAATPRFADLRSLHDYAFANAMADVVRQNREVFVDRAPVQSIPDRAAAIALSSMSDERTQWRLYRQEFHIAACSDSDLARMLHDAITGTDPQSIEELRAAGVPESILTLVVLWTHVAATGVAAVLALGIPLSDMDARPLFRWLFEALTGEVVVGVESELPPR